MRIAMIGTGYVGLVSGACIADFGHQVTCVDKDSAKIFALNSGEIPICEPGLKDIVQSNVRQGRLLFTTALSEALDRADAVFIAVGTPSRRGDRHADLSYVYEATRETAPGRQQSACRRGRQESLQPRRPRRAPIALARHCAKSLSTDH
jgi:UDPglucose 6-dehydrogenase